MKKGIILFLVILFCGVSIFVLFPFFKTTDKPGIQESENRLPINSSGENAAKIALTNIIEINYGNQLLVLNYQKIRQTDKVSLIPNFTDKEFGRKIALDNSCLSAINGGFYTKDNKPVGLFFANGEEYSKVSQSSVANGFFWQTKSGERNIGKNIDPDYSEYEFILQTGPYLTLGNYTLKLVTDEKARRSIILKDEKGDLFIASLYDKEENYLGPYLSDLPKILSLPEIKSVLNISEALNLDGGSASFFYVNQENSPFSLSEITPVGSVICVLK